MNHSPHYYSCTSIVYSTSTVYLNVIILSIALIRRYAKVIQNYYLRFMGGFDAAQMREIVMVSVVTHYTVHGFTVLTHVCPLAHDCLS